LGLRKIQVHEPDQVQDKNKVKDKDQSKQMTNAQTTAKDIDKYKD
jgi:hypothetical protein